MKNVTYINAGAGSGKTYHLTTELTQYLSQKDTHPNQIILTTFTELAAGEIKEKSRQALLKAENFNVQERVQLAVEMDSATIGTLHGIAFDFIRRYWYLLDYGADIQVLSPNNQSIYLNQSLMGMLTVDDMKVINDYYTCFGIKNENDQMAKWQNDLVKLIEKMNYYHVTDLQQSKELSVNELHRIFNGPAWKVDYSARLQTLIVKFKDFYKSQKECAANTSRIETAERCTAFAEQYWQYKKLTSAMNGSSKKFLISLTAQEYADWEHVNDFANSRSYIAPLENYLNCLFNIAQRWNDNFTRYKKEHHIVSYNDMELIFLQLLETKEEVREEIRQRYKLLMVDEFQDSNPIQLRIYNQLSDLIAENGGRSIWVGDPKQAIYGFRGSDSDLIMSIARQFEQAQNDEGLSTENLPYSWRSRKPLVDLVNAVFTDILTEEEIPNQKQIALKPHHPNDLNLPALHHWHIISDANEGRGNKGKISDESALANQVQQLLNVQLPVKSKNRDQERTVTYRDIAILVRTNDNVDKIADALRQQGIPVSTTEKDILQRKEVKLVMTILEYFLTPYNLHLHADLASLFDDADTEKLLGERIARLEQMETEDDTAQWTDAPFMLPLQRLRKQVERLSLSEIVPAIIYELNLPSLVGKWGEKNIRQQNLNTLMEMAATYDEVCVQMGLGATITGYLNYLRTTPHDDVVDNTSNTVKVLTYHKSKGLEWPVVIMTSLNNQVDDQQKLIKRSYFGINEIPLSSLENSPFDRNYYIQFLPSVISNSNEKVLPAIVENVENTVVYNLLRQKRISESKRVLYVGMTRARDYLITQSAEKKPLSWLTDLGILSELPQAPQQVANIWGHGEHLASVVYINKDHLPKSEQAAATSFTYVNKPQKKDDYPLKYLSPSKLAPNKEDDAVELQLITGMAPGITRGKWEDMAAVGTCIHNIFAIYQPDSDDNLENARRIIANFKLINELHAAAPAIIEAAAQLHAYLTHNYGPAVRIDHELPFYHEISGQIVQGEMDLVWNYEDHGKPCCVLVDYKTFPGNPAELKSHTRQYVPQLRAYRSALQAAHLQVCDNLIFYAVQGCLVKVKL